VLEVNCHRQIRPTSIFRIGHSNYSERISRRFLFFAALLIIFLIYLLYKCDIGILLLFNRFFPPVQYSYSLALVELKLHTLCIRRHHLDALFLTQVYFGLKFCPPVLEIVGLRVPARYIRDFALFNVCFSCKNCPSARCASAANVVCRDQKSSPQSSFIIRHNSYSYYLHRHKLKLI
jgi:hypothetical protein